MGRFPLPDLSACAAVLLSPTDETPALPALLETLAAPALLDSAVAAPSMGRFSILAFEPRATLEARGDHIRLRTPTGEVARNGDPLALLDDIAQPHAESPPDETPFAGGWIGFLGYGLRCFVERIPARLGRHAGTPDLFLALYDCAVVADRLGERTWLAARGPTLRSARARIDRCLPRIRELLEVARRGDAPVARMPRFQPVRPAGEYRHAVRRALEHIRAGDIFQVNLAHGLRAPYRGHPAALYRLARERNPAPFCAYVADGDWAVLSTSPERFLRIRNRRVETWPIKGTRPSSADSRRDARLRRELLGSEKDAAELAMIVDLERNDLGRVCEYGSVRVEETRHVQRLATVQHMVARVSGTMRAGTSLGQALGATFPGGSITGAPKVRAMEIIDALESAPRGPYTGSIGYFESGGRVDLNIAIRTVTLAGGVAEYFSGAGIVADSDPEREYAETLDKARAFLEPAEPRVHVDG